MVSAAGLGGKGGEEVSSRVDPGASEHRLSADRHAYSSDIFLSFRESQVGGSSSQS